MAIILLVDFPCESCSATEAGCPLYDRTILLFDVDQSTQYFCVLINHAESNSTLYLCGFGIDWIRFSRGWVLPDPKKEVRITWRHTYRHCHLFLLCHRLPVCPLSSIDLVETAFAIELHHTGNVFPSEVTTPTQTLIIDIAPTYVFVLKSIAQSTVILYFEGKQYNYHSSQLTH